MSSSYESLRRWLLASAVAVVLALAVGGLTRLTESGLSITEWRPVSGVLPPLTPGDWEAAYRAYLRIPEAQTVHQGITLGEFQRLYWWEWIHRMLARGVGLVLALPYFVLLLRRRIPPQYRLRLLLLPLLAAAQGVLGWYMVQSGLAGRTDVSAYRLTAHLAVALLIYLICVWTLLDLRPPGARVPARLTHAAPFALGLTVLTLLSGGFVAGLDGGKVYNTFPLMGGQLVPPGYRALPSFWRNAFENPIAAQFHHRILAVSTALVLLGLAAAVWRAPGAGLRQIGGLLALAVAFQLSLGIATLLLAVPVVLGVFHQLMGLAVLTVLLVAVRRSGGPQETAANRAG